MRLIGLLAELAGAVAGVLHGLIVLVLPSQVCVNADLPLQGGSTARAGALWPLVLGHLDLCNPCSLSFGAERGVRAQSVGTPVSKNGKSSSRPAAGTPEQTSPDLPVSQASQPGLQLSPEPAHDRAMGSPGTAAATTLGMQQARGQPAEEPTGRLPAVVDSLHADRAAPSGGSPQAPSQPEEGPEAEPVMDPASDPVKLAALEAPPESPSKRRRLRLPRSLSLPKCAPARQLGGLMSAARHPHEALSDHW